MFQFSNCNKERLFFVFSKHFWAEENLESNKLHVIINLQTLKFWERKVMILTLLLDANLSGMWNPSDVTETSHICRVMLNEARSISKGWS